MSTRTSTISALENFLSELSELVISVDISSGSQPSHPLAILRTGLNTHAEAASREASRFALVARLNVDNPDAGFADVCRSLAHSVAMLVANVQALEAVINGSGTTLRASKACPGRTLIKDVRTLVRNIVKTISGMVKLVRDRIESPAEIEESPQVQLLTTEDVNQVVAHCGRVLRLCEEMRQIPTTPFSAVKRSLLKTARLIKTSAQEIKEEHEEDLSAEEGDKVMKAVLVNGLGILRTSMNLLKFSLVSSESYYLAETSADTNADSLTNGSAELLNAEGDLDNVAIASDTLGDALIDFADAINTGGEEAILLGMEYGENEEEEEEEENEKVDSKSGSINADLLQETSTAFLNASKALALSLKFTRVGLEDIDMAISEVDNASRKFCDCIKP